MLIGQGSWIRPKGTTPLQRHLFIRKSFTCPTFNVEGYSFERSAFDRSPSWTRGAPARPNRLNRRNPVDRHGPAGAEAFNMLDLHLQPPLPEVLKGVLDELFERLGIPFRAK